MMKQMQQPPVEQAPALDAASYLPFVRKVASRVARRLPDTVNMDDLVSAGTVGLLEALSRYQQDSKRSFETYAEFRVKGAIMDELRRSDPVNRAARRARNRINSKAIQLTAKYGRPPEAEEVARALNTTVADYQDKLSKFEAIGVVTVDPSTLETETMEENQEELLGKKELVGLVLSELQKLPDKEKLVMNLYYVEELGQAQIADILGVSNSRVSQILSEVTKLLRKRCIRIAME